MNIFEQIIITLSELELYSMIASYIINCKYHFGIKETIKALIISSILSPIRLHKGPCTGTLLLGIFMATLYLYMVYRKRVIETIYVSIISIIIASAFQILIALGILLCFGKITKSFEVVMVAQGICILLLFFISKKIPLHSLFYFIREKNKVFTYIILNIFTATFFLVLLWYGNTYCFKDYLIYFLIMVSIMILTAYFMARKGLENQVAQQKLEAYDEYIPIIEELIQKIRENQHDFENHFLAIKTLIHSSETPENIVEKAQEYLDDLSMVNCSSQFIKIDNKLLGGFLYSKYKLAETKGIDFQVVIKDYYFKVKLKEYELIELLGILIDNAFETMVTQNAVEVTLYQEEGQSVIAVKNKHPYVTNEQITNMFKRGYSTKGNALRGIGLYKLSQIVEQAGGRIEISNDQGETNYVLIKVYLPPI